MSGLWHRKDPALFLKEKAEVEAQYPTLHFQIASNVVVVRGCLPVVFEARELDLYMIDMTLAPDHPKSLPRVCEIGGRIPWTPERHVNRDGTACILLPDDRWRAWPIGASLLEFLNGPVRNFFLGQSLVERGEPWPFGQWGHGADGIREYYADLLGTRDVEVVCHYLECFAAKKIKGHWPCPCGNGKRLRDCHLGTVSDLRGKIARKDALNSLHYLKGFESNRG